MKFGDVILPIERKVNRCPINDGLVWKEARRDCDRQYVQPPAAFQLRERARDWTEGPESRFGVSESKPRCERTRGFSRFHCAATSRLDGVNSLRAAAPPVQSPAPKTARHEPFPGLLPALAVLFNAP